MKAIALALLTAVTVACSAVAFASPAMNAGGDCTCAPCPVQCPTGCCCE